MKVLSSALVLSLFLFDGSTTNAIELQWHRNNNGLVKFSDSDSDEDTTDLMSNAELNEHLNMKAFAQTGVQSHAVEIKEVNDAVARLEKLVGDAEDPDWQAQSVNTIAKL